MKKCEKSEIFSKKIIKICIKKCHFLRSRICVPLASRCGFWRCKTEIFKLQQLIWGFFYVKFWVYFRCRKSHKYFYRLRDYFWSRWNWIFAKMMNFHEKIIKNRVFCIFLVMLKNVKNILEFFVQKREKNSIFSVKGRLFYFSIL